MAAIPGNIDTDQQPPMTVPLRHFLVGLAFLVVGALSGVWLAVDGGPPGAGPAHVHLLLAGWVCVTIMGAMTQFVPVWSGVDLHSNRLASVQLALVVAGLAGFAPALLAGAYHLLPMFGALLLAGFWVFVYNIARTLARIDDLDVTERHFAYALAFFLALTVLGLLLAAGYTHPVAAMVGVPRPALLGAHATLAVFGAVLTTVYGALYQLGTMFTQTELHDADRVLQRVEELAQPTGVVLLAGGRLFSVEAVATVGGLCLVAAALSVATILARKLLEMQVPWTPMHTRYAVAAPALAAWALLAVPTWLTRPTAADAVFGAPGTVHLLVLGAIGFVVLGTLYHIVPFVVWVHRYSDLLGFEDVPMIDDLYVDRLAALDATLVAGGTVLLVANGLLELPVAVPAAAGTLVTAGVLVFVANMVLVLRRHSPHPIGRILMGGIYPGSASAETPSPPGEEPPVPDDGDD